MGMRSERNWYYAQRSGMPITDFDSVTKRSSKFKTKRTSIEKWFEREKYNDTHAWECWKHLKRNWNVYAERSDDNNEDDDPVCACQQRCRFQSQVLQI